MVPREGEAVAISVARGVTLAIVGAFRATADTHTAGRRDLG
jgi:hypothetical protein